MAKKSLKAVDFYALKAKVYSFLIFKRLKKKNRLGKNRILEEEKPEKEERNSPTQLDKIVSIKLT